MTWGGSRPRETPRKIAIAQGHRTYFTGKPCRVGHITERFVKSAQCLDCRKEQRAGRLFALRRLAKARAEKVPMDLESEVWAAVNLDGAEMKKPAPRATPAIVHRATNYVRSAFSRSW